ncbi:MAG: HDOD domain-containing protein [Capsulimonadaceae bacterium]|nr:HDOD domain-containing protein [Capsulimonadaceae bacterium]
MTPEAAPDLQALNERIDNLVEKAGDLPAHARIALRVIQLVNQETTSATHIAMAISADEILAARVLRMANNSYYGVPRKISTLTEATVLLGMDTIRDIAIAASCHGLLDRSLPGYALLKGELWRHSNCCGYAAQLIARRTGYRFTEEALVAGLLHDIGKVAIGHCLADDFATIVKTVSDKPITFANAERAVLGFDHAQVGARMAERWDFPPRLISAIRYHHEPGQEVEPGRLTQIVHAADYCCLTLGIGLGRDGLQYEFQEDIFGFLGLDEAGADTILSALTDYATVDW